MSATRTSLRFVLLACFSCVVAMAQSSTPQSTGTPSSANALSSSDAPKNTQAVAEQTDEPVSLAEAARLARANKANPSKPAKSYDDDNFPRSTPIVKKNVAEGATTNPSLQELPAEEMHGKVVLLDFWASWCGPCRDALPKLKQLQSIYGSEDFMVISVSEDDEEATWRAFVANHQMNWTQRFDGDNALLKRFQVSGLPTYVLLDRDGKELQRYIGEDPGQSIVERIGPDLKRTLQTKP